MAPVVIHHGKILKELVRIDERKVEEIAHAMGYSHRENLYLLYKSEEFNPKQLKKIKKAKLDIMAEVDKLKGGTAPGNLKALPAGDLATLIKEVRALRKEFEDFKEEYHEGTVEDLRTLNRKFNAFKKALSGVD